MAADLAGMEAMDWSREAIADLVAGKRLFMRGADAEQVDPPEWLAEIAGEVSTKDSAQSVESAHPEDRTKLIDIFLESSAKPGVVCPLRVRVDHEGDGAWTHIDLLWVNLLDHPDVQGIICAGFDVDGPTIEPPETTVEGTMGATNWMIVALDDRGRITSVRGPLEEILGHEEDEVLGHLPTDFIHPDCVGGAIENWLRLQEEPGQTRASRWMWRHKDGSDLWLESSYLVHDDGMVEVVIVDVNEQVANDEALAASRREIEALAEDFRLLADEVPTAVFRCNREGEVQFHNAQWAEMFHLDAPVTTVHDLVHPDHRPELDELLGDLADQTSTVSSRSIEVPSACGVRVLEIRCRAVSGGDDRGRFVGSVTDVTAAAAFRHQAMHDQLTGLANRSMIESLLADAVRSDPEGTVAVFIDLDGFKAVNDDHGHEAGDAVLIEVGRRLSGAVRPGDAVARYGGDEFVVVCRGVVGEADRQITDRLEGVFGSPIEVGGSTWEPRASIGVARPEPGVDAGTVLRRADQAMFEVKRARRSEDPPGR